MKQHAMLCLFGFALGLASGDGAAAEDLASLREKVSNNLTAMTSLEVKFQVTTLPLKSGKAVMPLPNEMSDPEIYLWAKQGTKESLDRAASQSHSSIRGFSRLRQSFDGQQSWEFRYSDKNSQEEISSVSVRNVPRVDTLDDCHFAPLIGARVRRTKLSLLELMRRPTTRYEGVEDAEGYSCHKVEFGEYEGYTDFVSRLTIWFDPQFDYLPRKIESAIVRQVSNNRPFSLREVSVNTEFSEVYDHILRRKRWFPLKSSISGYLGVDVLEVRMNPTFNSDRFTPQIPDGTQVDYWDKRIPIAGTGRTRMKSEITRMKSEITGGAAGQELFMKRAEQRSIKARDEQLKENERAEHMKNRLSMTVIAATTFTLICGVALVWKRSR